MKVLQFIFCFIFFAANLFSQKKEIKEIDRFFSCKKYDTVLSKAKVYLEKYPDVPEFYLYMGMALVEKEEFIEAGFYLEKVTGTEKSLNDITSSRAYGYLACCHFMLYGDEKAENTFEKTYCSNGTYEVQNFINAKLFLFGLEDLYNNWIEINTRNFNFRIADTTGHNIHDLIQIHEHAFDSINLFFEATLPKKIDFFIWNNSEDTYDNLNVLPPFASPVYCCIHTLWEQPPGHEITHILSHYSGNINNVSMLFFEGIAVYFDLSNRDRTAFVKAYLRKNNIDISIKELWKNWDLYPKELSYPLAGLFVEEIINSFGKEYFLNFFEDQTYENALNVFGPDFELFISDFELGFSCH